jgi:hypothetical protein
MVSLQPMVGLHSMVNFAFSVCHFIRLKFSHHKQSKKGARMSAFFFGSGQPRKGLTGPAML